MTVQTAPEITRPTTAAPRRRMSYEAYLRLPEEGPLVEWVEGEVIVHMPPTEVHQDLLTFLAALMRLFAHRHDLGKVIIAPFEMRTRAGGPAREPDILFVARDHLDRFDGKRLAGAADLLVEIVSGDSVRRDRIEKFREYREAGVSEYWIIDPRPGKHRADAYALTPEGDYELFATDDDPRMASRVLPEFWLNPEWLWNAATTDALEALIEILGLSSDQAQQIRTILRGT